MERPVSAYDLGSETQEFALASASINLDPYNNDHHEQTSPYDPKRQLNSTGTYSGTIIGLQTTAPTEQNSSKKSPPKKSTIANPFDVLYLKSEDVSPQRVATIRSTHGPQTSKTDPIDNTEISSTYLRIDRDIIQSKSSPHRQMPDSQNIQLPPGFNSRHHPTQKRRMISIQTQTDPISPSDSLFNFDGSNGPIVTIVDEDGIKRTGSLVSRSATDRNRNRIKSRNKIARKEDFVLERSRSNSHVSSSGEQDHLLLSQHQPEVQEEEEVLLKPNKKLRYNFPVKRQTSFKWRGYKRPKQKPSNANFKSDKDFDDYIAESYLGQNLNDLLPLALKFYKYSRLQNRHPQLSSNYNKTPMYLFSSPTTPPITPEHQKTASRVQRQNLQQFGSKTPSPLTGNQIATEKDPLLHNTSSPAAVARVPPVTTEQKPRRNYLWFTSFASALEKKNKADSAREFPVSDPRASKMMQVSLNRQLRESSAPSVVNRILVPESTVNHAYFQLKPINPEGKLVMSDVAYGKYKTAVFRNNTSTVPPKFEEMFANDGSVVPILSEKEIAAANQRLLLEVLLRRTVRAKVEYRLRRALEGADSDDLTTSNSNSSGSSSCYSSSSIHSRTTGDQSVPPTSSRQIIHKSTSSTSSKKYYGSTQVRSSYGSSNQARTPFAPLMGNLLRFSNFELLSNSASPGTLRNSGGTATSGFPSPQVSYYSRRPETVFSDNPSPEGTPVVEQPLRFKSRRNFQPIGNNSVIIEQDSPDKEVPELSHTGEIESLTSIYNSDGTPIVSHIPENHELNLNVLPLQSALDELMSLHSIPKTASFPAFLHSKEGRFDELNEFSYSYKRSSEVGVN